MITLNESKYASFREVYVDQQTGKEYNHVYVTPEGKFLPGVTGMIKRQLFPKKYGDIPASVLARAAERGHAVHAMCEQSDRMRMDGADDLDVILEARDEASDYATMRHGLGMSPIANEYCVSLPTMASCIDCVWEKDGDVYLADIKTTYELDEEYLSWQLSIYAYMFEKQNPGLSVKGLYGVWLYKCQKDKTKTVEIQRKPDADVEALIEAEANGETFSAVPQPNPNDIVAQSVVEDFYAMAKQVEQMNEQMQTFKDFVKKKMEEQGINSYDFGLFKISVTPESESDVFDSSRFKNENPETAKAYMKKQKRSASLRITLR